MKKAIYCILLLCGILFQEISGLSEENNKKSSDIHIRKRRIAGGQKYSRDAAPYLVHLLDYQNAHCPGSLLTNDVAITSAACCKTIYSTRLRVQFYTSTGPRISQAVEVILLNQNYNVSHPTVNNLALVKFSPAINLTFTLNRPISIFSGNLAVLGRQFKVTTWGRPLRNGIAKVPSTFVRSLSVNLISIQYCKDFYPGGIIGSGNLCTFALKVGEHCDDTDSGAALVSDNHLVGIMVYHGHVQHPNPDVFMNLVDPGIRRWIHQHVPSLRLF